LNDRRMEATMIKLDPRLAPEQADAPIFSRGEHLIPDDSARVGLETRTHESFLDIRLTGDHHTIAGKL
jgi:CTP synthase (UTP-ammonia lyase)